MKTLLTILALLVRPFFRVRSWIIKGLLRLRAKLQLLSLRTAIVDADKDKNKTGRKNMVVFNAHKGAYEPIQKRLLKTVARAGKNNSNRALTPGRRKMLAKSRKKRLIDHKGVHHIENKSLYVTN